MSSKFVFSGCKTCNLFFGISILMYCDLSAYLNIIESIILRLPNPFHLTCTTITHTSILLTAIFDQAFYQHSTFVIRFHIDLSYPAILALRFPSVLFKFILQPIASSSSLDLWMNGKTPGSATVWW